MIDLVSGADIAEGSEFFTNYQGSTYYFESQENKEDFDRSPGHFVARGRADGNALTEEAYPTKGTEVDSVDANN